MRRMDVPSILSTLTGVPSKQISAFSIPPARTAFYSDHSTFFAKHTVHDGEEEANGAMIASQQGVSTPALHKYYPLGDGTSLLVFEYLGTNFQHCSNPIPALHTVWQVKPPQGVQMLTSKAIWGRSLENLSHAPETAEKERILPIVRHLLLLSEKLEQESAPVLTWIHGDAHARNIFDIGQKTVILDWEWHRRGAREIDVAKWIQVNLSENEGHPEESLQVWHDAAELGLDMGLVKHHVLCAAVRAYTFQLRWKTNLDLLEPVFQLASGAHPVYNEFVAG